MYRIYNHQFLIKLPHSLLLSKDKATLVSKERADDLLYNHFVRKLDQVNASLSVCTLSEIVEKEIVEDEEDSGDNDSFFTLMRRER